ncbi:MAG: GxxExxY protein [Cyclobacteriaceae bacterium]
MNCLAQAINYLEAYDLELGLLINFGAKSFCQAVVMPSAKKQMAELFDKDSDTIGLHLKNIFTDEELDESSTTEVFSAVQKEGKREVKRNIAIGQPLANPLRNRMIHAQFL